MYRVVLSGGNSCRGSVACARKEMAYATTCCLAQNLCGVSVVLRARENMTPNQ